MFASLKEEQGAMKKQSKKKGLPLTIEHMIKGILKSSGGV